MPRELTSARLQLRQLGEEHLTDVHGLFAASGHTIGDGPVSDPSETLKWLRHRQMRHEELGLSWYGLWDPHGRLIGTCGVMCGDRCGDDPEIGYEVDASHRRQGFAAEAAGAVTGAAHRAGHERLWATIRPNNVASSRIVMSLGYTFVSREEDSKGALDYYVSAFPTTGP